MAYRLKLQEPIGQGVRRIALEQIEIAVARLTSDDEAPVAIHDTRRCLKRLRALLRLAQLGLDETVFDREMGRLVGIGKLLSGARDLHVVCQTLGKLERQLNEVCPGATRRLQSIVTHKTGAHRREGGDHRRQALAGLAQSKRFFSGKSLLGIEVAHLIEGLGHSYRRTRKAFRHAYTEPSDEAFHALRKRVQLHWRHMALLSRGWPEALTARATEAKELSRLLGDDHDYAILLELAREHQNSALEPHDVEALTALCAARQAELRAAAKPRLDRLFVERSRNLKRRVERYWSSALDLAALTPSEERAKAEHAPVAAVKRARRRPR